MSVMFSHLTRLTNIPRSTTVLKTTTFSSFILLANRHRQFSSGTTRTSKFQFVEWYESHLQASPVRTKMVTGGLLWGLGDVVAQVIPTLVYNPPNNKENSTSKSNILTNYDLARTSRAVFFGFVVHAPIAHLHYNFLESLTVRLGIQGLYIPVFKAFMEQFVYWSWLSNTLYHGTIGALQGMNMQQVYDRLVDVLWETQKAQWAFWIPVQLLNFRYVPVRHQLNVVLVTSVVWAAFLSFIFPPTNELDNNKEEEKK